MAQETGVTDEHYDVISVLYHALQGAETCRQYIADDEQSGKQEMVEFFREVQDQNRRLAEKAKELLAKEVA